MQQYLTSHNQYNTGYYFFISNLKELLAILFAIQLSEKKAVRCSLGMSPAILLRSFLVQPSNHLLRDLQLSRLGYKVVVYHVKIGLLLRTYHF